MADFAPQSLPHWRRAVLKVGSSLLADPGGGLTALELLPALLANLDWREDRLRAAIDSGMYATDVAVEAAIAGVPFREAYKAAAASSDTAGQGRTPEGSLAARTSPGAPADLRLDVLRARWEAL